MAVYVAAAAAVIALGSAIYGADRSRYAMNTQQDAILRNQEYNKKVNAENEAARLLGVQSAYQKNAYETAAAQMQEMRYGLMLQQYGMQEEYYGMMAEMAGNQWSLRQEVYDWQQGTLDWEADFRQQQADFLKEQGVQARGLYGTETAKLLAHQRMMNAAAGIDIGVGSPVEVLGEMASERQYASDIMEYNTGIDIFGKLMEKADVLNQKNKVGFDRSLAEMEYGSTLADLGYKSGVNALNIQEATGLLGLAKQQTSLIQSDRGRIGSMNEIELSKYTLGQDYGEMVALSQSGYYGNAASNAGGTGLALNVGSSIFNSFNTYYTAKKMFPDSTTTVTGPDPVGPN